MAGNDPTCLTRGAGLGSGVYKKVTKGVMQGQPQAEATWGRCAGVQEYAGWYFQVYLLVHLLSRESSAWPTPTARKKNFYKVRVGQLSLCSQALLLRL